jgi:prepilin-type N-terminal cleavage/methylation domain-containing protein
MDFTERLPRPKARSGFTLVESVVSLGVFSLLALGIINLVLQLRRIAENNVYENTGLTMAQGYIEQIRSLPYNELVAAANSDTAVLRLLGANGGGTVLTDSTGGALNNDEWTRETVFLDRDANGNDTQPLQFRFHVLLTDLRPVTAINASGVEIALTYELTLPDGRNRSLRRSLRTVRSVVPTY